MKIAAVIAYMPYDKECIDSTLNCMADFKDQVDWIILIQNGIRFEHEVNADVHIVNRHNLYHGGAVNQGYASAVSLGADFVAFINNDIGRGNVELEGLCIKGVIASPRIADQPADYGAHASFFVTDVKTFRKVGYWDSEMAADEIWFRKAEMANVPMTQVFKYKCEHGKPAMTVNKLLKYGNL